MSISDKLLLSNQIMSSREPVLLKPLSGIPNDYGINANKPIQAPNNFDFDNDNLVCCFAGLSTVDRINVGIRTNFKASAYPAYNGAYISLDSYSLSQEALSFYGSALVGFGLSKKRSISRVMGPFGFATNLTTSFQLDIKDVTLGSNYILVGLNREPTNVLTIESPNVQKISTSYSGTYSYYFNGYLFTGIKKANEDKLTIRFSSTAGVSYVPFLYLIELAP